MVDKVIFVAIYNLNCDKVMLLMAQSFDQTPFTFEIVGSTPLQSRDIREELVNVLPKVEDFLRVPRFPPTGDVDRVVRNVKK